MPKRRDIRVSVRLTADEWVGVCQAAGEADVYASAWVRMAVQEQLRREVALDPTVPVGAVPALPAKIAALEKEVAEHAEQQRRLQRIENMHRNAK